MVTCNGYRVFWCEQCETPVIVCPSCNSSSCSSDSCDQCAADHVNFMANAEDKYPWSMFTVEDIFKG